MNFANILHFAPFPAVFMKYTTKIVFQKVSIQWMSLEFIT
jgi:hypothetical protein